MEWIKKAGLYIPSERIELPKGHHSLSNWDFRSGEVYALDNTIYVSSPTSLRITKGAVTGTVASCLCTYTGTTNLPEGRLSTWWRTNSTGMRPVWIFRNQGTVGTIDQNNTYRVWGGANNVFTCDKVVGGGLTTIGTWTLAWVANTWYLRRVTWWKEAPVLIIRFEYWDGSAWQNAGVDLTDASPSFEGSSNNRVGFGWSSGSTTTMIVYYDDGMIYGPA